MLFSKLKEACSFLEEMASQGIPEGRYPFPERNMIAIVSSGKGSAKAPLEAHKKYIDLQFIQSGVDTMGWSPLKDCKKCIKSYEDEDDKMLFEDTPHTYFDVHAGEVAIFFPEDAHAPMSGDILVKKIILKVLVEHDA